MSIKALIADDDPDAIALLGMHLQKLGIDVHATENPREAVDFFKSLGPDVVFMDIGMPFPGGFITVENIRHAARKLKRKVVIIMYTASSKPEDVKKAQTFGADDYLLKPVTPAMIREKLRRFFPKL